MFLKTKNEKDNLSMYLRIYLTGNQAALYLKKTIYETLIKNKKKNLDVFTGLNVFDVRRWLRVGARRILLYNKSAKKFLYVDNFL